MGKLAVIPAHVFSTASFSWFRWLVQDLGKAANQDNAARARLETWRHKSSGGSGEVLGEGGILQGVPYRNSAPVLAQTIYFETAITCSHVLACYQETHSAGQRILAASYVYKILYNVGIHHVATMTKKFY